MRSYDESVFRDYNMDGVLSFGRYRRESGKAGGGSANRIIDDISSGFGEWYKIKLVVRGENVDVYFGDAEKPVMNVVNTYSDKGAICLVSVGSGEFYADNIKISRRTDDYRAGNVGTGYHSTEGNRADSYDRAFRNGFRYSEQTRIIRHPYA